MVINKHIFFKINLFLLIGIALYLGSIGTVYGQSINTIKFDITKDQVIDTAEFDKLMQNVKVVGIGEATHGDHESQVFRKALILDLIKTYNFSFICIEERNKNVKRINQIIHSDTIVPTQKIEQALLNFDYWLWKNQEFVELIKMLNKINLSSPNKVSIVGVDTSNTYGNTRDSFMAAKIYKISENDQKAIYLAHNFHVSFEKDPENKWAGNYLKEQLGLKYYSIGIMFNSGCFNAFSKLGFKTFCEERPKKLSKLSKFFLIQNCNHQLIDFNRINNISALNNKFEKNDYSWHIGHTYGSDYHSYWKSPSILKSWDGVIFIDVISESRSFIIPGNFFAKAELTLSSKSIHSLSKDSFKVIFKSYRIPLDSSFNTQFYIEAMGKNKIYYFNQNTTDFYQILGDSSTYTFTFPYIKEAKKYSFGFSVYGNGQILISDFKITGDGERKIIYNGLQDFKFTGGNRFVLKYPSLNEMLIYSLDKP